MSNNLLTGLTEAWEPDATLAMIGQVAGLNTTPDAGLTYGVQAGFPNGHSLKGGNGIWINTPASVLVSAIGAADFLMVYWLRVSSLIVDNAYITFKIGEDNSNGADMANDYLSLGVTQNNIFGEIPGADNSYNSFFETTGDPFNADTHNLLALWYTTADHTLHMSVNGGTIFDFVNTTGVGDADLTNEVYWYFAGDNAANDLQLGDSFLWQGTAGVANAVSQLANMFNNKIPFSAFDSGGASDDQSSRQMSVLVGKDFGNGRYGVAR